MAVARTWQEPAGGLYWCCTGRLGVYAEQWAVVTVFFGASYGVLRKVLSCTRCPSADCLLAVKREHLVRAGTTRHPLMKESPVRPNPPPPLCHVSC